MAQTKGLYEQYGAMILVAADSDVYQEIEVAVDLIRGSHVWGLWWD